MTAEPPCLGENANAPPTPRGAGNVPPLPFTGRIESFQFLGLGHLAIARALCRNHEVQPVAFGEDQALVQLSFMKWNESPVGPYCASFVGLAVMPAARSTSPGLLRRRPAARAANVLSAFLRAPRLLLVTNYTVGDLPGGPVGCGKASQQFGRDALAVHQTVGGFVAHKRDGVTHLQALETHVDSGGQISASGFSLSTSTGSVMESSARLMPTPARLPLSASLLSCVPLLAAAAARSMRDDGAQTGALLIPAHDRPGALSCIATRFTTRPRLRDLTADRKLAFTPMVLGRPAPDDTLGRVLERLHFTPFVSMWDPTLVGSILGPVPRFESALA